MMRQDRFTQQATPCHPEPCLPAGRGAKGLLGTRCLAALSMTTRRDNQEAAGFNRRKMNNEQQNER